MTRALAAIAITSVWAGCGAVDGPMRRPPRRPPPPPAVSGAQNARAAWLEEVRACEARVHEDLARVDAALPHVTSVAEGDPVAAAVAAARVEVREHAGALGARAAATLVRDIDDRERRLNARLAGVAEVDLLNLTMRAADAIDVLEFLVPDPIDVDGARAELRAARAKLAEMRAVLAAVPAARPAWTGLVDSLDRRLMAAAASIEERISRRERIDAIVAELCAADGQSDAAKRKALLEKLGRYKVRYDRRSCR